MGITLEKIQSTSGGGIGKTLSELITAIQEILQDPRAWTNEKLIVRINDFVTKLAAGIRMPNGGISPPFPDLYKKGSITTSTTLAYVSLPSDYQRKLFKLTDSSGSIIPCPGGGDYYSFALFLNQISNPDMTDAGEVYKACVKGNKLYYQGIPSVATIIGAHYYRKPVPMELDGDYPDGIPEQFQLDLIKHGVLADIFGSAIEDGQDNRAVGTQYHAGKFMEAMTNFVDFIGIDAGPQYYGSDSSYEDGAIVD